LAPVCREELTPEMVFWAVHDRITEDYAALARRARDWTTVDVYRIGFDSEGMCEPVPLVRRFDRHEAIRMVYREMWRAAFDGPADEGAAVSRLRERWTGEKRGQRFSDFAAARRALEGLSGLAKQGESLAQALITRAGEVEPSLEALEAINAEIEWVDLEIARQGHVEEAVASLSTTYALGKENLSDTRALAVLSRETLDLYRELGRWVRLSTRFLDALDSPTVRDLHRPDRPAEMDGQAEVSQALGA